MSGPFYLTIARIVPVRKVPRYSSCDVTDPLILKSPFCSRCPFRRGQAKGLKEAKRLLEAGGEMDGTGKAGDLVDAKDPDMLF